MSRKHRTGLRALGATGLGSGDYGQTLPRRREQEGDNLASLTGWDRSEIRKRMGVTGEARPASGRWWERLWPGDQ